MINVQPGYKNCASVVRKYLPITAAGGQQPYFIICPPPHFSKSTGNNFLSAALDLRCVHAQVSVRAQSIINQRQVDMSAGPRNGGRLLLFSSALSQCCFTISLERKKSHFPFSVGCSENRNHRRCAQPTLIHMEEGEKMGNRKFLSLAFYFMAASKGCIERAHRKMNQLVCGGLFMIFA